VKSVIAEDIASDEYERIISELVWAAEVEINESAYNRIRESSASR